MKPDLKKSQSVVSGKLFYSFRILSELAQGPQDSKTSALNYCYDGLARSIGILFA